ncbi:cytochrome c biogenesis CcdA family protein [Mesorhizobium sp. DCY119]|uniref:cytochrome c biogenesis CcdA family protein n=1 Tax=Mesorhizobium sp. DCY119 TaxID=2108445 RepID=UPI000E71FF02|nr:cytochrome c biogenesis CcdA family protein [Mesorhizobium sp. DCY119]RJG40397.1 cytochrome c biogenesis protein CcdA [Mesorhizobium sp. DCY119]
MLITIGLAFLAGVITVLSPCVLPLLPVIFATAAQEGKARPIGVLIGFVGSFTLATLALSFLVRSLGLSPDLNRILAAAILVLLGLVLAIPPLQHGFERFASGLLSRLPAGGVRNDGLSGGLAVGVGLGLAWSPCVGPIMASVITLALNQQVNLGAVAVTLAFALGTAIPMASVIVGGRRLVTRLHWFQSNAVCIQRVLGVILVLTGVAIFFGWDRAIQVQLLTWFPNWEQALTGWEPKPALP